MIGYSTNDSVIVTQLLIEIDLPQEVRNKQLIKTSRRNSDKRPVRLRALIPLIYEGDMENRPIDPRIPSDPGEAKLIRTAKSSKRDGKVVGSEENDPRRRSAVPEVALPTFRNDGEVSTYGRTSAADKSATCAVVASRWKKDMRLSCPREIRKPDNENKLVKVEEEEEENPVEKYGQSEMERIEMEENLPSALVEKEDTKLALSGIKSMSSTMRNPSIQYPRVFVAQKNYSVHAFLITSGSPLHPQFQCHPYTDPDHLGCKLLFLKDAAEHIELGWTRLIDSEIVISSVDEGLYICGLYSGIFTDEEFSEILKIILENLDAIGESLVANGYNLYAVQAPMWIIPTLQRLILHSCRVMRRELHSVPECIIRLEQPSFAGGDAYSGTELSDLDSIDDAYGWIYEDELMTMERDIIAITAPFVLIGNGVLFHLKNQKSNPEFHRVSGWAAVSLKKYKYRFGPRVRTVLLAGDAELKRNINAQIYRRILEDILEVWCIHKQTRFVVFPPTPVRGKAQLWQQYIDVQMELAEIFPRVIFVANLTGEVSFIHNYYWQSQMNEFVLNSKNRLRKVMLLRLMTYVDDIVFGRLSTIQ